MRALLQRVSQAEVRVADDPVGRIGAGLLILLGIGRGDDEESAAWLAAKCAHLRIFDDDEGRMNRSLLDTGGNALVVSQFTLYGDCKKGRRPSYTNAAPPEKGERTYIQFPFFKIFRRCCRHICGIELWSESPDATSILSGDGKYIALNDERNNQRLAS